jgi:hypothetical protein
LLKVILLCLFKNQLKPVSNQFQNLFDFQHFQEKVKKKLMAPTFFWRKGGGTSGTSTSAS